MEYAEKAFVSRSLSKRVPLMKMATGGEVKKGKLLVLGGTGTTWDKNVNSRENTFFWCAMAQYSIHVLTSSFNCYKDFWARLSASELFWRDTRLLVSPGEGSHRPLAAHHLLREISIIERETLRTN
jgi:hypothetical protein